jgi:molybdenum cofactor cytidylyltransferase
MKSSASAEVYGIVPASGFSRRMGKQKLLLSWQDVPLLEHVLITARNSSLRGVLTIIPAGDEERSKISGQCNCHTVYNDNPERGIGYSLALGIKHIPRTADAVIILLGDQPELKQDDIERVIIRFQQHYIENHGHSKIIIQTQYTDNKVGHPILFSKHFFSDISQLDGDRGGNKIITSNLQYVSLVESINSYPDDIDTMEDFTRLLDRQ